MLALQLAQVTAFALHKGFHFAIDRRMLTERCSWEQVVDDVVLHTHENNVSQLALECPGVSVTTCLLAWMRWHPRQKERVSHDVLWHPRCVFIE